MKQNFISNTNSFTNLLRKDALQINENIQQSLSQLFPDQSMLAYKLMIGSINEINEDSIQQCTEEYSEKINQKIKQFTGLLHCKIQEPRSQASQSYTDLSTVDLNDCTENASIILS